MGVALSGERIRISQFSTWIHILFVFTVTITHSRASRKQVDLLKKELKVTQERKMTAEASLTSLDGANNVRR